MSALSALAAVAASEAGLVWPGDEDAAYAGNCCSPSPTAWAATPPGMGTTLTAILLSGGRAALARTGDSRAFRLDGG